MKVFDKLTHMNLFSKMTSEAAKTKQRSSQNRLLYAMQMEYNVLFCVDQWMKRNNKVVIQYSVDSPLNSLHEININILTKIHVYILYDIWTEKNPNKNKNKSPGKVYILTKIFLIVKTGFNCVIFLKSELDFYY